MRRHMPALGAHNGRRGANKIEGMKAYFRPSGAGGGLISGRKGAGALFGAAKAGFSLTGAVIGAGFISGAELVRFFPTGGFLPHVAVAALLFFACFLLLFECGRRFGGFAGVLRAVFGRRAKWMRAALLAGSFITCGSMLAGLSALAGETLGLGAERCLFALSGAAFAFALAHAGMRGLYAVNLALVPAILLFLAVYAAAPGTAAYAQPVAEADAWTGLVRILLYVAMNLFLAAPVACDLGARSGRKEGGAGCALSAGLVGFGAAVVLANIGAAGDALYAEMPFLRAVGAEGVAGALFAAVSACGIFTTLIASYYPLHGAQQGKARAPLRRALLCAGMFLFSLLGLTRIVRFVYPLLGAAGLLFLLACAFSLRRLFFDERLFRQRDKRVHARREHAQDHRRRHHEV